jgi:hypothetical protein
MIISHKHRYLFLEIPLTGSWSIRRELSIHYDGVPILHKHATYPEFLQIANNAEKDYFVFACVRNPLDKTVSGYFKVITDHKDLYLKADDSLSSNLIDYSDYLAHRQLSKSNQDFETVFTRPRVWERPYSSMIDVSQPFLDYVIKFENLNDGFAEVLSNFGINQIRPLPRRNVTGGRQSEWQSYYTPRMIEKAKLIYGPFMERWGYEFPSSWGDYKVSKRKRAEYKLVNRMKLEYLTHVRYNNSIPATAIRKVHAYLKTFLYR